MVGSPRSSSVPEPPATPTSRTGDRCVDVLSNGVLSTADKPDLPYPDRESSSGNRLFDRPQANFPSILSASLLTIYSRSLGSLGCCLLNYDLSNVAKESKSLKQNKTSPQ
ncbi:hypothetical protein WA026_016679 [Henosepilachna vigintioctopunctata]|uniref:Uncharacterized protein n=1 Tax=Henosepilachna vigintioctopunctata TaxID=420089 RepID=A0AAW1UU83_9CUCU